MKKIVLILIGLMVIGTVSVVADYLSNNVTATVDVGDSLLIELREMDDTTWKKDIGIVSYDGNPVKIVVRVTNLFATDVIGKPYDRITGTDIGCDDFYITVNGGAAIICDDDTDEEVKLAVMADIGSLVTWTGGEVKEYEIAITFVPGARGEYKYESRVMIP